MTDTTTHSADSSQAKTGGTGNATVDQAMASVTPMANKAKQFAKDRPYTAAALAGVVGLALLNTLRGR